MKKRILCTLLCCFIVFTLFSTYGGAASAPLKKVVIVQESKDTTRDAAQKAIIAALTKAGFTDKKNIAITQIQMNGDLKKSASVVSQIKSIKPAVAIINNATTSTTSVGKALEGSGIPTIVYGTDTIGVVDAKGYPKGNVAGLILVPKSLERSCITTMNKIVPLNGKKAVFLTVPGIYNKADIISDFTACGVKLKEYRETKYIEDFKAAVIKYNKDPEVGWICAGVWPSTDKNGKGSQVEIGKWDIANRAKPSFTNWGGAAALGFLVGVGIDLTTVGTQQGEMAAKILKGDKIKTLKSQEPRKILIELNQKTAERMNIKIPASILGSAAVVSKDELWYDKNLIDPSAK